MTSCLTQTILQERYDLPTSARHYNMSRDAAFDLRGHDKAEVLTVVPPVAGGTAMILDLCMAPGGFALTTLANNCDNAKYMGVTLPRDQGGQKHWIGSRHYCKVDIQYIDINTLVAVTGLTQAGIPMDHPDAPRFRFDQPFLTRKFGLVFCDGQVPRFQEERGIYREVTTVIRYLTSQLVFALQRIRAGGTLLVLLPRLDNWTSAQILCTVRKFAKVRLFKSKCPKSPWARRGTFFLVAEGVDTENPEAQGAVEGFKRTWRRATFEMAEVRSEGDPSECRALTNVALSGDNVDEVLASFGPELVEMAKSLWKRQLDALRERDSRRWNGVLEGDRRLW